MTARIVTAFLVLVASVLVADAASAQCAMCVTALEQNGGEIAAGFNRGILFLLGVPYLVVAAIGVSWYRKHKLNRVLEPVSGAE